jgi:hypothetical protein
MDEKFGVKKSAVELGYRTQINIEIEKGKGYGQGKKVEFDFNPGSSVQEALDKNMPGSSLDDYKISVYNFHGKPKTNAAGESVGDIKLEEGDNIVLMLK